MKEGLEHMIRNIIDKHGFLRDICNWNSHRILIGLAVEETKGSSHPILELGMSQESTPALHDYCEKEGRLLLSYEENILQAAPYVNLASPRHEIRCVSWDAAPIENGTYSVAVLDHAPGERRWADAMRLLHRCEILVLHDTEPAAEQGYGWPRIWPEFRFRVDVKSDGAWSTALSNSRELTRWRGLRHGPYVVSGTEDDLREDPVAMAIERALYPEVDPDPRAEAVRVDR